MNTAHHFLTPQPDDDPAPAQMPGHAHPGDGTGLTSNIIGQALRKQGGGQVFNHPWRPFLSAGKVLFNRATIASFAGEGPIEPKIAGVPMSGKDGNTPTLLDLKGGGKGDVSFAVLEVTPNDDGELMKDSKIEIVHSDNATASHTLDIGRTAIALILWSKGTPVRVLPILFFNLRYARVVPTNGGGAPRHYFL
jgi:hypothetical protein